MKKRSAVINTVEIIMIIAAGILLFWQGFADLTSRTGTDMHRDILVLDAKANDFVDMNLRFLENYELVQKHFANLAAYYLSHSKDPFSDSTAARLKDLLGVRGICILDPEGSILASAGGSDEALPPGEEKRELTGVTEQAPVSNIIYALPEDSPNSHSPAEKKQAGQDTSDEGAASGTGFLPDEIRLEQGQSGQGASDIADFSEPGEEASASSEDAAREEVNGSSPQLFVSCLVDPGHIVVLRSDMEEFKEAAKGSDNELKFMQGATYGLNGTFFFVDGSGQPFEGGDHVPGDGRQFRVPAKCLTDGFSGFIEAEGKWYYSAVKKNGGQIPSYLVCALPAAELFFPLMLLCMTRLIIVLFSLVLMRLYAGWLSKEALLTNRRALKARVIRGKLFILMLLCAVVTAGSGMYLHTLYLYSTAVSSNAQKTSTLQEAIAPISRIEEYGTQIYRQAAEVFTRTSAALVSGDPEFKKRENLAELAGVVGADHILVYDTSGKVMASDRNYTGLSLSGSANSQSGAFRWVIYGEPVLIQDEVDSSFLNQPYLLSASPLQDEKGDYLGMVQLAFDPEVRDNLAFVSSLESILSPYDGVGDTIALAVEKDKDTVYSSYRPFDGQSASELGLTQDELADGYTGFFVLQLKKLIGCCQLSSQYRVIVASFTQHFPLRGMKMGFTSALPGIALEFVFFLFLLLHISLLGLKPAEKGREEMEQAREGEEKAELVILRYVKSAVFAGSLLITCVFVSGSILFRDMSPGYYIFVYPWKKGLHIFTVTRCLCCIFFFVFVMTILMKLLSLLGSLLPSKQETFVRLLLNFSKYLGGLGVLYFCMTLFGVSTTSLLASAGALAVIFSIGAQTIVADILAGLFIIFEGSFKVGDMITVDDWHGQVVEIGIRNTTIRDLIKSDVKIISNSTIKRVINFSEYPSLSAIRIGIEYGTDLRNLEEIIERERPVLKQNLPLMVGELRYLGVDEFADSAIIIKFEAACKNQHDLKMKRALNREILLMLERNGIHVPFPQVVVHEGERSMNREQ